MYKNIHVSNVTCQAKTNLVHTAATVIHKIFYERCTGLKVTELVEPTLLYDC